MKIVFILLIFVSGINFANNLSGLIETNLAYEPAWWKAWLSLLFAVIFSISVLYNALIYFNKEVK